MVTVTMELSDKMNDLMNDLQKRADAPNRAEVIRRAVSIYDVLLADFQAGNPIRIVDRQTGKVNELIVW